jgi:hypothetical protein
MSAQDLRECSPLSSRAAARAARDLHPVTGGQRVPAVEHPPAAAHLLVEHASPCSRSSRAAAGPQPRLDMC